MSGMYSTLLGRCLVLAMLVFLMVAGSVNAAGDDRFGYGGKCADKDNVFKGCGGKEECGAVQAFGNPDYDTCDQDNSLLCGPINVDGSSNCWYYVINSEDKLTGYANITVYDYVTTWVENWNLSKTTWTSSDEVVGAWKQIMPSDVAYKPDCLPLIPGDCEPVPVKVESTKIVSCPQSEKDAKRQLTPVESVVERQVVVPVKLLQKYAEKHLYCVNTTVEYRNCARVVDQDIKTVYPERCYECNPAAVTTGHTYKTKPEAVTTGHTYPTTTPKSVTSSVTTGHTYPTTTSSRYPKSTTTTETPTVILGNYNQPSSSSYSSSTQVSSQNPPGITTVSRQVTQNGETQAWSSTFPTNEGP